MILRSAEESLGLPRVSDDKRKDVSDSGYDTGNGIGNAVLLGIDFASGQLRGCQSFMCTRTPETYASDCGTEDKKNRGRVGMELYPYEKEHITMLRKAAPVRKKM